MSSVAACEPISWLRLERYQLDELPPAERDAVAGHLSGCERCRACLEQIRTSNATELLPLPVADAPVAAPMSAGRLAPDAALSLTSRRRGSFPRRGRITRWGLLGLGAAGAAAAALLLVIVLPVDPRPDDPRLADLPSPRRAVIRSKGGDVTFELVRERGGSVAWDAAVFAARDRFKVLLTCPPPLRLYADVVVVQGDGAAFALPGPPVALSCGNRVPLPGAFRITGPGPASVCVAVDQSRPPARDRLRALRLADAPADPSIGCLGLAAAGD